MRLETAGQESALSPKVYCHGAALYGSLPGEARGRTPPTGPAAGGAAAEPESVPARPRGPWWAFGSGLRLSLRHWPLLFVFYLALALVALLILLPLEPTLVDWFGYRLAAWEVAEGLPGWLGAQVVRELPGQGAAVASALLSMILALPASLLLFSLPFTLLGAGALTAYAEGSRRRFWPAVARYIGSFALLQLLEVALLEVSIVLTIVLGSLAAGGLGLLSMRPESGGASAILLLLAGAVLILVVLVVVALAMLIPWWFEYARVVAVLREQRHVLRVLGQSASFLRRHLGAAAGLALFNFLLVLAPYAFYGILTALLPASWWPAHMVLQQLLILAIIGTRLARLAAQVRLVQARSGATAPVGPAVSSA